MRSRRSLTCAAMVLGLLACSDRSMITRSVSAHGPASAGRASVPTPQVPAADIASAIRAALADGRSLRSPFTLGSEGQLIDLYAAGGFAPLWVDNGGRPSRDARDALALLTAAATEGLDPEGLLRLDSDCACRVPGRRDVADLGGRRLRPRLEREHPPLPSGAPSGPHRSSRDWFPHVRTCRRPRLRRAPSICRDGASRPRARVRSRHRNWRSTAPFVTHSRGTDRSLPIPGSRILRCWPRRFDRGSPVPDSTN